MKYTKTNKITCNYKVNELPEDWANQYEAEDLETMIEEAIDERAKFLIEGGYVEGEFLDNINTDIHGLETPEDGWRVEGWITIE